MIFGRTSVQNDYDLSVTTTGKVEFSGAGITEATSGIPSVTFNLYALMNSTDDKVNSSSSFVYNLADGQEHYVGVWNLKVAPKVFYQRISGIIPPWNCRKMLMEHTLWIMLN